MKLEAELAYIIVVIVCSVQISRVFFVFSAKPSLLVRQQAQIGEANLIDKVRPENLASSHY